MNHSCENTSLQNVSVENLQFPVLAESNFCLMSFKNQLSVLRQIFVILPLDNQHISCLVH